MQQTKYDKIVKLSNNYIRFEKAIDGGFLIMKELH